MKSPILSANPSLSHCGALDADRIASSGHTDIMILRDDNGYYLGTLYQEKDANGFVLWQDRGTVDSEYFTTLDIAKREMVQFQHGDFTHARLDILAS